MCFHHEFAINFSSAFTFVLGLNELTVIKITYWWLNAARIKTKDRDAILDYFHLVVLKLLLLQECLDERLPFGIKNIHNDVLKYHILTTH